MPERDLAIAGQHGLVAVPHGEDGRRMDHLSRLSAGFEAVSRNADCGCPAAGDDCAREHRSQIVVNDWRVRANSSWQGRCFDCSGISRRTAVDRRNWPLRTRSKEIPHEIGRSHGHSRRARYGWALPASAARPGSRAAPAGTCAGARPRARRARVRRAETGSSTRDAEARTTAGAREPSSRDAGRTAAATRECGGRRTAQR